MFTAGQPPLPSRLGLEFHQGFQLIHDFVAVSQAVPALLNVQVSERLVGIGLSIGYEAQWAGTRSFICELN
jgi:hypothetical protein